MRQKIRRRSLTVSHFVHCRMRFVSHGCGELFHEFSVNFDLNEWSSSMLKIIHFGQPGSLDDFPDCLPQKFYRFESRRVYLLSKVTLCSISFSCTDCTAFPFHAMKASGGFKQSDLKSHCLICSVDSVLYHSDWDRVRYFPRSKPLETSMDLKILKILNTIEITDALTPVIITPKHTNLKLAIVY